MSGSSDHDRVQELMALRALGGLDEDDAALAEQAMLEHVPDCDRCRPALDDFRLIAGDLALATVPVRPPPALLARLRRTTGTRRRLALGRPAWAAAAVAILVASLAGWNAMLTGRLSDTETIQSVLADAVTTLGHPDRGVVSLSATGGQRVAVIFVRGDPRAYVIGSRMPAPQHAYHVWFVDDGRLWHAGMLEVERGVAMLPVPTDPQRWDAVLVTDEPEGEHPAPRVSPVASATVGSE